MKMEVHLKVLLFVFNHFVLEQTGSPMVNQGPPRYIWRYKVFVRIVYKNMSALLDSNQGPPRYKLGALTN